SGLPTLAVIRETATNTNRHFDLIAIEMIVRSREKQIKEKQSQDHHGGAQNNNRTSAYVLIVMTCHSQHALNPL
ncbi:MAG: hypothetical protein ACYSW7_05950, partial [Planctomycetota bacterium]